MAKGAPDWWSRSDIDIEVQTLAELIQRPKYGGAQFGTGYMEVSPLSYYCILTVTGTGMIYGGWAWCGDSSASQKDSFFNLYIDEVNMYTSDFKRFNKFNLTDPLVCILPILLFDDVNYEYVVGFSRGITFEEKFRICFKEAGNVGCKVRVFLWYAII